MAFDHEHAQLALRDIKARVLMLTPPIRQAYGQAEARALEEKVKREEAARKIRLDVAQRRLFMAQWAVSTAYAGIEPMCSDEAGFAEVEYRLDILRRYVIDHQREATRGA